VGHVEERYTKAGLIERFGAPIIAARACRLWPLVAPFWRSQQLPFLPWLGEQVEAGVGANRLKGTGVKRRKTTSPRA
jgi:hypothetical protein